MSTIQTRWQSLLKRNMSRKEFLGLLGLAALIVLNIEPLLRLFGKSGHPPVDDGYGSTGYSGFVGKQPASGAKTSGFD
jgi:hypothetical protein